MNNWILVLQSKSSQITLKSIAVPFIPKSFLIGVSDTDKLMWIFNISAILSQVQQTDRLLAAPMPDMGESWMGKNPVTKGYLVLNRSQLPGAQHHSRAAKLGMGCSELESLAGVDALRF